MANLRILTGGESHGRALVGIVEGMPAGLRIDKKKIDHQLRRRQCGYGRGGRMKIEWDEVEVISGIRFGITLGSPITLWIRNRDWENWEKRMDVWRGRESSPLTVPRPGHADLAGGIKYDHSDMRNVLERASARETAMRVAAGSIVRQLLEEFGIWIASHVIKIHEIGVSKTFLDVCSSDTSRTESKIRSMFDVAEKSELRFSDSGKEEAAKSIIDKAREAGDTVGGVFEVAALNVPPGLGSYSMWDRRLDGRIALAVMSIPGIKAVEIGMGFDSAGRFGSEVHDSILKGDGQNLIRPTNRAGGIEGGVSNGQPIIVRAAMKPIPTLQKGLPSVDMLTGDAVTAHKERSDVCAVPAASIVGEAMVCIVLGMAFCERFGGDSMKQIRRYFKEHGQR